MKSVIFHVSDGPPTVVICIAGRSNGLGPVFAANSTIPVINAPNVGSDWASQDIWSSLRMPAGWFEFLYFQKMNY